MWREPTAAVRSHQPRASAALSLSLANTLDKDEDATEDAIFRHAWEQVMRGCENPNTKIKSWDLHEAWDGSFTADMQFILGEFSFSKALTSLKYTALVAMPMPSAPTVGPLPCCSLKRICDYEHKYEKKDSPGCTLASIMSSVITNSKSLTSLKYAHAYGTTHCTVAADTLVPAQFVP